MIGLMLGGCVERMITIQTEPPGAIAWLNDEEVGATPVEVRFNYYGTWDLVLRKQGYETIHVAQKTNAPLYAYPPLDLLAENVWPGTIVDEHHWQFVLKPAAPADPNRLIQRAQELRQETIK